METDDILSLYGDFIKNLNSRKPLNDIHEDIFATGSVIDVLNDITAGTYIEADQYSMWSDDNTSAIGASKPEEIIDTKKENPMSDKASWISGGELLLNEYNYTLTQVTVLHNRHFEKVQYLMTEFYKIKVTDGSNREKYDTYMSDLIYLNTAFKTSANLVLTKKGMAHCNDIYNWYEGIK
jgi:hypothetical protein